MGAEPFLRRSYLCFCSWFCSWSVNYLIITNLSWPIWELQTKANAKRLLSHKCHNCSQFHSFIFDFFFATVACADKHSNCKQWASSGECLTNPDWMLINCQESCGLCCELNSKLTWFIYFLICYRKNSLRARSYLIRRSPCHRLLRGRLLSGMMYKLRHVDVRCFPQFSVLESACLVLRLKKKNRIFSRFSFKRGKWFVFLRRI